MATLALPITDLLPVVAQAEAETKQVVVCSKAETADKRVVLKIAWKTLSLRWQFIHLANRQTQLINTLVQRDFSTYAVNDLKEIAGLTDRLVDGERDMLQQAHQLGSEIRAWWHSSLVKLTDQVEHLDSIAESLHVAADPEASVLMGMAVERFTAKEKAPVAM